MGQDTNDFSMAGKAMVAGLSFLFAGSTLRQIEKPPDLVSLSDEDLKTIVIQQNGHRVTVPVPHTR